jgi:hypothetical protein
MMRTAPSERLDAQRRFDLRRASLLREIARFEAEAAAADHPAERERLKGRAETYRCALHEDRA